MIYILALIVWIILDVLHGGRPWGSTPLVTVGCLGRQADRSRSGRAGLRGCGSCAPPLPPIGPAAADSFPGGKMSRAASACTLTRYF